ncbi:CapA family protein [Pelotalea chapellei]|uniref:CapA family protein n=1 Tax=Pelotalea chapellei TaxID=44671 RepID=A0ABS5U9G4_9BACT|nr:CapA family protein [Pelotalea chapellei]MBT1072309.1 CapA family protein [Pelotalea chapellei]
MKLRALPIATYIIILVLQLPAAAEEIVINAVGDIMLAGRWTAEIRKKGYDFPFAATSAELAQGDINLANLESPISRRGQEFTQKKFRFRAEPAVAKALRTAGFNLVTLANNHSMDFGGDALSETLQHLESAGVAWIGAGENLGEARKRAVYTVKNKKIAFLGYSLTQPIEFYAGSSRPGTTPGWEKVYTEDIARARREADYVVVSFHWGAEGSTAASPYQRTAAHKAIDAGADAVIGHHPHVLQGMERYKKGIIFYSLGNFAFASTSTTADFGALLRLRFNETSREAEILPLDVLASRVRFQPRVLTENKAAAVIDKLNLLSAPFNTEIQNRNGRYVLPF